MPGPPHHPAGGEVPIEYKVALEIYEGPLDLLLRLIERQELDITSISLAIVADQYLDYIDLLRELSPANLADFLVIAAKLLVIKSRALLPRPEHEQEDEEEEDLGDELARQLIEYRRFKEVAQQLKQLEEQGRRAYPRVAPPPHIEPRLEPGQVSLADLLDALQQVLDHHQPAPPVDKVVSPVVIRITDCIGRIDHLLNRHRTVRLSRVLRSASSRLEVIVHFMAVLEMIKRQRVRVTQEQHFGEIYLRRHKTEEVAEGNAAAEGETVDELNEDELV